MQQKLLSALVASACLFTANGGAKAAGFPNVLPDFVISNFSYTPNLTTGMTNVSLTVLNQSLESYSTQRSPLFLRMWTGTSGADKEVIINNKFIEPMGNYGSRTYSWETPTNILSKNLYAKVDPNGIIQEIVESNNDAVAVRQGSVGFASVEMQSTIKIDAQDGFGIVGDTIEMLLTTIVESEIEEALSAIVSITDEEGKEIFISDLMPLDNESPALTYTRYYAWNSGDIPEGTYIINYTVWGDTSGSLDETSEKITLGSIVENNPPIAEDDSATTTMNESVEIDLQFNDVEPDGHGFIHYINGEPQHGEVEVLRGIATYTPDEGFVGVDNFSYQMNDYSGASDWAKVTVDVLPLEHGCTWIRDFEVVTSTEKTAIDAWSDYELPEDGIAEHAAFVQGNSNPDLFEVQPFISFPSCSLYFQPKAGTTGTATVVYNILDKATEGETYTSEARTFDITLAPETVLPEFISTPPTLVPLNTPYSYVVELSDDGGTLTALELPDFLDFENSVITGTANDADAVGMHKVALVVDNGVQSERQEYLLTVEPELSVVPPTDSVSDDDAITAADSPDSAAANGSDESTTGVVETGGSGGFNPLWLLLSLPLLRRLR